MLISIKTFNGHNINDGSNYRSTVLQSNSPPAVNTVFIENAISDPVDAGTWSGTSRTIPVAVEVVNYANRNSLSAILKNWLKPGVSGNLVVTFTDVSADYQLTARVQSVVSDKFPGRYTVILQSAESAWRAVTASTDTWTVDASGEKKTISVGGYVDTRLITAITPTGAASSGYSYQQLYQLVGVPGVDFGKRPWSIALDTATLVSAGKMQADCDDLRVFINDVEVKRWIADANTSSTKAWFNVTISPGFSLDLKTAIGSNTTIGEIEFKITTNNQSAIYKMPNSGIVYHGTEWIQYSGKDWKTCRLAVVARGALGTTKQAHNAADVFKWVQNVVYIVYGNASAVSPSSLDTEYDNDKPVFDLSTSDNTKWAYTASSKFYDHDKPTRPGSWVKYISTPYAKYGDLSGLYDFKEDATSGDTAGGLKIGSFQYAGKWYGGNATLWWYLQSPVGIRVVSATGQKYRNGTAFPVAQLQGLYGANGKWYGVWTEASPVNGSTWTAWTHNNQAISWNPVGVGFSFIGSSGKTASELTAFEALTVTVEFVSANLPVGALLGEAGNYPLKITITNNTTGDIVYIEYPMKVNKTFALDGETYTASYDGVNAHGAVNLDDDSRDVWIALNPGNNELQIDCDDIGTLSVALSWYARRL